MCCLSGKSFITKNATIRVVNVASKLSLHGPGNHPSDEAALGVLAEEETHGVYATTTRTNEKHVVVMPQKRQEAKKRVSFALQQVRVRRTVSWRSFSPAEAAAIWYTEDEYKRIQKACCREVIRLEQEEQEAGTLERNQDKELHCSRGLEYYTRLGHSIKKKLRAHSIRVVLEEQDAQCNEDGRSSCKGGDAVIAYVYHQATANSLIGASATGLTDWHDAEEYYLEDMADL
jgi:hypothetical protein